MGGLGNGGRALGHLARVWLNVFRYNTVICALYSTTTEESLLIARPATPHSMLYKWYFSSIKKLFYVLLLKVAQQAH